MIKTHVKICHNITKLYCFVLKTITIFNDLCQKIHRKPPKKRPYVFTTNIILI